MKAGELVEELAGYPEHEVLMPHVSRDQYFSAKIVASGQAVKWRAMDRTVWSIYDGGELMEGQELVDAVMIA
jgi:hypothetical protein